MQKRLNPRGLVVFNVNPHQAVDADLRAIRAAFGQTYVFHTADTNLIVLATLSADAGGAPRTAGPGQGNSISGSGPRFPSRTSSRRWCGKRGQGPEYAGDCPDFRPTKMGLSPSAVSQACE